MLNPIAISGAMNSLIPISRFNKGEANKIFKEVRETGFKIVLKNNSPTCVLLTPEAYNPSIIGPGGLNFRVRDGNGWNPSDRYTFRAGQNLPDKEFRYLRTVIVTAAVYWGFNSKLRNSEVRNPMSDVGLFLPCFDQSIELFTYSFISLA